MEGFSAHLFWDCDAGALDGEAQAGFIIGRVLSRGTFADWGELMRRYGAERLREEVVALRDMDAKAVAFCSAVLDLTPESFRCTKKKFSGPGH